MFRPVELYNPATGSRYTARDAVDLNDRLAEGYRRYSYRPAPAPRPRKTVESSDTASESTTDSASDTDDN